VAGVLHGGGRGKGDPIPRCWSCNADGVRASKVEHSVEDLGGDGDLGSPGLVAVEAQPVTDDLLPARELALDPGPLIIAAVALPGHPPFPCNGLDVAVALGGLGVCIGAEYGIGPGWDDDHGSRMALVQGGVHAGSVIRSHFLIPLFGRRILGSSRSRSPIQPIRSTDGPFRLCRSAAHNMEPGTPMLMITAVLC
jgi:hypothetical protein